MNDAVAVKMDVYNGCRGDLSSGPLETCLRFSEPMQFVTVPLKMAREILRFAEMAEARNLRVLGGAKQTEGG